MLWKIGLPLAGGLCLIYYAAVCIRLRKWDSAFSRFWLAAGAGCMALRAGFQYAPQMAECPVWKLLWIPALLFLAVELLILSKMRSEEVQGLSYIIVLGAQVAGTKVTDSLRRRLKRACIYLRENPQTTVIVSGGQGTGESMPEACVMREFLIREGIGPDRIICEDKSKTTMENLKFSAKYIGSKDKPVGIVSNNFHMYRACGYAKKLGYKAAYRIPAGCNPLVFPNYMVREFFAVLKFWIFI